MAEAIHLLGLPKKHKPKDIKPQGAGSGLDADMVDGEHGHRAWNWADEQGFHRRFVLPFTDQYGWNKQGSVFQKSGVTGKFDQDGVQHPCVVRHGGYYYLFYGGIGQGYGYNGIGVARSTSPSGPYTRLNNGDPILRPTVGFDKRGGAPTVIYDDYETDPNKKWKCWFAARETGQQWAMYYSCSANPDSGWSTVVSANITNANTASIIRIGSLYYASAGKIGGGGGQWLWVSGSPTGPWTEIGKVLSLGAAGEWDDAGISYISVLYILGTYYIIYSGYDGSNYRIGMCMSPTAALTSGSLTTFYKYARNPVLNKGSAGEFDSKFAFSPAVLQVEHEYYMWYTGDDDTDREIGLAKIP